MKQAKSPNLRGISIEDVEPPTPRRANIRAPEEMSLPEGWLEIAAEAKTGEFIRLSIDGQNYVIGRWKPTRHMIGNRWMPTGLWVDELNRPLSFEPKYWARRK